MREISAGKLIHLLGESRYGVDSRMIQESIEKKSIQFSSGVSIGQRERLFTIAHAFLGHAEILKMGLQKGLVLLF